MSNEPPIPERPADCASSCDVGPARRAFLRAAATAVAGALVAVGLAPAEALARPLAFTSAVRSQGNTVTYPIPAEDGAQIDRDHDLILVRWQGRMYAFDLSCPHQNTALRWLPNDGRFQCPKHKSKYRPDGTFISGRATRGMDRYPLRREGASVVVETAHMIKESNDATAWAAAVVTL